MTLCYGRCTVDASVTAGAITRRIRDRARRLTATSNAAVPVATTRSTSNSRLPSPPSGLTCSQFSIQFTSSPLAYRQTGDRHYKCIRGEHSVATSELYGKFIRHSIGLLLTAIPRFPGLLGAILDLARGAQRNSIAADLSAAKTAKRSAASRRNHGAKLERLPGVGHYDFLSPCSEAGKTVVPQCKIRIPHADTHSRAIEAAQKFFSRNLKNQP